MIQVWLCLCITEKCPMPPPSIILNNIVRIYLKVNLRKMYHTYTYTGSDTDLEDKLTFPLK
jgi:hypothetical protein